MAFTTTTEAKETAYSRAQRVAERIKGKCTTAKASMEGGSFDAGMLVQIRDDLIDAYTQLGTVSSVPGVLQYAKDVEDDQAYDVGAEFTAMRAAILAAKDAIDALAPTSGGYLALWTFPTGSGLTARVFSSGATASLQANMQSIIEAIN